MTLPFAKDDGKRKWQCFVCGHNFTEYETFKAHIIEKHEEGREYVICPLERCGAPVRDIRLHFKAKHPHEKTVPKVGQMKAMVWKDQTSKGKVKAAKSKFREGYLVSNKNNGQEMHYRSGYECEVYECLEALPEVLDYKVEPFKVQYNYINPGTHQLETHDYNPDILVNFTDGKTEIWEVKPANQTHLAKNQAKWAACQSYCQTRGWDFIIMTEVGIGKLKQRVKQQ
jgi:hypothetical protein